MTSEGRRFYLLSQILFASVSAIPWVMLACLCVIGFRLAPLWSLFVLAYGIGALFLFVSWLRFKKRGRTSNGANLASVLLWAVPFLISLGGIVMVLVAQFDGELDIAFDVGFRPIRYSGIPILSAIWFGIPLLYAVLLTKGDWTENTKHNA